MAASPHGGCKKKGPQGLFPEPGRLYLRREPENLQREEDVQMAVPLCYTTLAGAGEAIYVDRKSRFLGHAATVTREQQALSFLKEMRERYRDASHNCYAYRLRDNNLARYSDDGEPAGTAGLPMMEVLIGQDIVDVVVVVTRYFGGTLLGTGGLVRAYTKATQEALRAGGFAVMTACDTAMCSAHYNLKTRMEALIAQFGGGVDELEFGADLLYTYYTPDDQTQAFEASLTELTLGEAQPLHIERRYRPILKEADFEKI